MDYSVNKKKSDIFNLVSPNTRDSNNLKKVKVKSSTNKKSKLKNPKFYGYSSIKKY